MLPAHVVTDKGVIYAGMFFDGESDEQLSDLLSERLQKYKYAVFLTSQGHSITARRVADRENIEILLLRAIAAYKSRHCSKPKGVAV